MDRNIVKKILGLSLLILFLGYFIGVTCFVHSHNFNGRVVVHSHPYAGTSENPEHTHTSSQFQLIEHLSVLLFWVGAIVGVICIFSQRYTYCGRSSYNYCQSFRLPFYLLRAPPANL